MGCHLQWHHEMREILKNGISNHVQALIFCCWLGAVNRADFDGFRGTNLGSEMHLIASLVSAGAFIFLHAPQN